MKVADFCRRFVWASPMKTNRWHIKRRGEGQPLCGSYEDTTELSFECVVSMHRDHACPDCVNTYYRLLADFVKENP